MRKEVKVKIKKLLLLLQLLQNNISMSSKTTTDKYNAFEFSPWPIHIALCTYPNHENTSSTPSTKDFVDTKKDMYAKYKDKTKGSAQNHLYNPKIYHIFGAFDLAFITLIDSYKFAQRLYEDRDMDSTKNKPVSYQVIAGIAPIGNNKKLSEIFPAEPKGNIDENFVLISNLKLNNAFLIGAGHDFLKVVIDKIESILKNKKFIAFFSYNWCEITLIQFGATPNELFAQLLEIRELHFSELADSKILKPIHKKSLYGLSEMTYEICKAKNVFSDTNSYLGAEYYKFKEGKLNDYDCMTDVELHIKPGALHDITKNTNFETAIKDTPYFINGKMDLLFKGTTRTKVGANHIIYENLRTNIKGYVRRLKTSPIYNKMPTTKKNLNITNTIFANLKDLEIDLMDLNDNLSKLKISRQIREKIIKMFTNYNNGIIDPISYGYMIDLRPTLCWFKNDIAHNAELVQSNFNNGRSNLIVYKLENEYSEIIDIFESAFTARIFNNYNFEEFNDFQIDFNNSITQLTCTYDSLVKIINNTFFKNKQMIVTHQNETTISNFINVNYNAFDLLEPAIVFNALIKEVFNLSENKIENTACKESHDEVKTLLYKDFPFLEVIDFDVNYFLYDLVKYEYVYNKSAESYEFWSWVHMLQHSKNYDSNGSITELAFLKEYYRIQLVLQYNNIQTQTYPNKIKKLFNYYSAVKDLKTIQFSESSREEIGKFVNLMNNYTNTADTVHQYCKVREEKLSLNKLSDGYNYIISGTSSNYPEKYYLNLMCHYLEHLKINIFKNEIQLLPRCASSGKILDSLLSEEATVYVDPFGGFYIKNMKVKE
jgi:hypothetical protein